MPLPSAIFPAALFDGGRVIDNPVDTVTDLSSDADTDRIGGAAINRLKAEMKSVQAQLKTEFQIDFNLKEGNAIVFDADRDTYIQADADDQLGFYVGGAEVVVLDASYMGVGVEFEVFQGIYPLIKADANKNVMLGSPAAHITTDTEGFVYLNTVNGTPTGVPATTHGDSKPIVYDKVNDALYVYNAGWQAVGTGTVAGSGTDNFVPVWTASDTLGNSAYGDDGTYGTFMGIGSSTFNDASTLMKWRGATVPSSFLASSGSGQDLFIRLQDAASGGGGNGASLVITPGAKDGAGTDGKFIVRQPGGVAGTDEAQIYDDGTASVFGTRQSTLQLATSAGVVYNVDIGKIRPASDAASALGIVSVRWTNLFLSGGVCWGTGAAQDLEISRDAASIFRLSTSGVTDALTFCKISGSGSAPASYTAAAGAGIDVHFRAQDAAAGSGQPGGSFYFRPGNRGTTGNRAEFYILDSDGGSQSLSFKCTGGSSGLISYNGANIPIVFSINTTNSFAVTPTFSGSITASEQGSWGFWTKKAFYLSPNSTSQSLGLGAHSTTAFQFFTSATQSDSTTCLLLGANTAPSAYQIGRAHV